MGFRSLHKVKASQIGVVPYYLRGHEHHGLQFEALRESRGEPHGAQCGFCFTILWITGRSDPILNEKIPENVPDYGPGYTKYHREKLNRFLRSLPTCPECNKQAYDLFINNVTLMRFEDGTPHPEDSSAVLILAELKDKPVWWYGDQEEAKRLDLTFL